MRGDHTVTLGQPRRPTIVVMTGTARFWDGVWEAKSSAETSWFQEHAEP